MIMEVSLMWSDWSEIDQPTDYRHHAVYIVRLCGETGIPICINRFLDSDANGILWIGKASDMEGRRRILARGHLGKGAHSEARLLHILETVSALPMKHPRRKYEYSYIEVKNSDQASKIEEEQIKAYIKQFGEAPPLNSVIPNRGGDWQP
jgi:hypothetical protein